MKMTREEREHERRESERIGRELRERIDYHRARLAERKDGGSQQPS
jgi:hypothetical protein